MHFYRLKALLNLRIRIVHGRGYEMVYSKDVIKLVVEVVNRIDRVLKVVPYNRDIGHAVAYCKNTAFYIIYTRNTLRNPRSIGIDYSGEMLGVKTPILTMNVDYIVWAVDKGNCIEIYAERVSKIHRFCIDNKTIYRNRETGEHICNYPVKMATKIYERCVNALDKYINTIT
jgi:hypothetical protein